eukprot:3780046-Rhodomonas_salina.1
MEREREKGSQSEACQRGRGRGRGRERERVELACGWCSACARLAGCAAWMRECQHSLMCALCQHSLTRECTTAARVHGHSL